MIMDYAVDVKFPKQWKRWLERAGLKISETRRWKRNKLCWFCMTGYNRQWRIDRYGNLCVSCLNRDFDRWAISEVMKFPFYGEIHNEKDFVSIVKYLLLVARKSEKNRE